jgi:hypothetical protein
MPTEDDIDERIREQLSKRADIFRLSDSENPFMKAAKLICLVDELLDFYNETVRELWKLGYNQFPEADGVSGFDLTERGGCMSFSSKDILGMLADGPKKQAFMWLENEVEAERRRRADANPKRQKPPINWRRRIARRLGYEPQEWVCVYCRKSGDCELGPDGRRWHVDHMYPRVHGGDDKKDNKALSCASCNLSKNSRTATEFLAGDKREVVQ